MAIETTEIFFPDDPASEAKLIRRVIENTNQFQSMPSHQGWFDVEVFARQIHDMSKCEIHVDSLDRLIISDPEGNKGLQPLLTAASNRLSKLQLALGLDASKVREWSKGIAHKSTNTEMVLALPKDPDNTA